jgi:hypothetical protein
MKLPDIIEVTLKVVKVYTIYQLAAGGRTELK